jgi:sterol desaturase/sphingolipid hydroxylase (fatty acid hydroxylase superfamily)
VHQSVVTVVAAIAISLLAIGAAVPVMIGLGLIERFGPCWGERPSFAAQLRGLLFQIIGVIAGSVAMLFVWPWLPKFSPLWPGLAFPLALLVSDCLQYWEHRMEHHWLLWRFHAVHHSTRELTGASNIAHFTHQIIMTVTYGLPMALICGDPMGSLAVIIPVQCWAAYIHSPAKINIGPLRLFLTDNRTHRIHHSLDPKHFEKNFGRS